jgi:hypothetical protein
MTDFQLHRARLKIEEQNAITCLGTTVMVADHVCAKACSGFKHGRKNHYRCLFMIRHVTPTITPKECIFTWSLRAAQKIKNHFDAVVSMGWGI